MIFQLLLGDISPHLPRTYQRDARNSDTSGLRSYWRFPYRFASSPTSGPEPVISVLAGDISSLLDYFDPLLCADLFQFHALPCSREFFRCDCSKERKGHPRDP